MNDRDQYEVDQDLAIQRAEDLAIERPGLSAAEILTILDDEFRGSCCYPGATSSVVAEVYAIWRRTRPITG